jgi:hypothetical protein
MQLDLVELIEASKKRDEAIASVACHADENHPGWTGEALGYLKLYAEFHQEFISEECSAASHKAGLVKAHDPRAWGQVFRAAAKAGVIRKDGYAISNNRNRSPTVKWRSLVYRGPA